MSSLRRDMRGQAHWRRIRASHGGVMNAPIGHTLARCCAQIDVLGCGGDVLCWSNGILNEPEPHVDTKQGVKGRAGRAAVKGASLTQQMMPWRWCCGLDHARV